MSAEEGDPSLALRMTSLRDQAEALVAQYTGAWMSKK